jgi:hypothetical protein
MALFEPLKPLFHALGMKPAPLPYVTAHTECHRYIVDNNQTYIQFVQKCNFLPHVPNYTYFMIIGFITCHILEAIVRLLSSNLSIYKNLNEEDRIRYPNKIVSYIHAVESTVISIITLLNEPQTWDNAGSWADSFAPVLGFSVGYFIYDLVFFFRMRIVLSNIAMVIHHLVCVTSVTYCVNYRIGAVYNIALLFTEITTPLYHHRWFFLKLGMADTMIYKVNGAMFWILFFFCRVVWCFLQNVHLWWVSDKFEIFPWFIRGPIIVPSLLFLLNTFWFVQITMIVLSGGNNAKKVTHTKKNKKID